MPRTSVSEYLSATISHESTEHQSLHRFLVYNANSMSVSNLAQQLGTKLNAPVYMLAEESPTATDLIGETSVSEDDDSAVDVSDGVFTKALRSSQDERTILTIPSFDDVYSDPELKTIVHGALDTSASIPLSDRSGYLEGDANNLIVLAGTQGLPQETDLISVSNHFRHLDGGEQELSDVFQERMPTKYELDYTDSLDS